MNDNHVSTELEQIVQKMVSAGEPEANIAAAIKQHNTNEAAEAPAKEPTESKSKDQVKQDISSAIDINSTGFRAEEKTAPAIADILGSAYTVEQGIGKGAEGGSRLSVNNITITNPNGVSRAFEMSNNETLKSEVLGFLESEITEEQDKGKEWVNQRDQFDSKYLKPYFTPENLKKIESGELKEEELLKTVKDDIGANDWFFQEGRSEYLKLSDSDLDKAIKNRYNLEKDNKEKKSFDALSSDFLSRLQKGDYRYTDGNGIEKSVSNESEFLDIYRNSLISTFKDEDEAGLATLNMQLLHGNLSAEDRITAEERKSEIISKLKDKGEYSTFFDLKTGELIRQPITDDVFSSDTHEDVDGELEQIESDLTAEFQGTANMSPLDLAEERFNKNSKALAELEARLNVVSKYEYSGISLKDDATEFDKTTYIEHSQDLSLKDAIYMSAGHDAGAGNYAPWQFDQEGSTERNTIRKQHKALKLEQEALKRMYLLNEDVLSIEKNIWSNAGKIALASVAGQEAVDNLVGTTEREVVDEYSSILSSSGIPVSTEQERYAERGLGETVLEGGAGSVGILLEFAVANKMTAAARGLSLFKGGKNLNQILNAAKGKKFYNGKKAMTVAQTKAAAAKAGMGHRTWLLANGYDKSVKAGALSRIGVVTTEALIEGAKFAALPSSAGNRGDSFATGFGFGAAGQILGPALGTIKASSFSKNAPAWLPNAAPRLEKIYNLGFKGPLNFVVGSEVGEMGLALTDDLMGYEEFSTFIDEHYGDSSENLKRWASNWAIGTGFGFTHKAAYKKAGTLNSLRDAKAEAESNVFEKLDGYLVYNNKTGSITKVPNKRNYQTRDYKIIGRPGQRVFRTKTKDGKTMTDQYKLDQLELAQGLEQQIRRSEDGLDITDRVLGAAKLKNRTKEQLQFYKDKGADIKVEYGSDMFVVRDRRTGEVKQVEDKPSGRTEMHYEVLMEPMLNRNAEVYYKDKNGKEIEKFVEGGSVVVRYHAERFANGYAPHELGHSGMEILFGTDARFKSEFVQELMGIAKKIKLSVGESGEMPLYDNLYDQMVELNRQYDVIKTPWEAAKTKDWELFSHIAEHLSKPENLRHLQESGAFPKLKKLINGKIGGKLGQKYNLTKRSDIVDFFGNYIEAVNKGKNTFEALEHLQDVIAEPNSPEMKEMERLYNAEGIHFTEGSRLESKTLRKEELIKENMRLHNEKPEGYEAQIQQNVIEIRELKEDLVINRAPVGESDDARKERVNNIEAANKDVIFEKDAVGRNEQRRGEAIDAIINSYRGKTIAIAKQQGRFETPTFENMSVREKENFAWDMTQPELIKHLDAFNRKFRETGEGIENTDLDGYLNSYLTRKLGTALEKKGVQKKEFTGTTTDIKPGQEPGYTPSEMKLNAKTDARLKVDIRERMSDLAKPERAEQIKQGIKDLNNYARDYIEKTADIDGSYRGLKNIKTPKDIVDKVFGKNTKERVNTIGQTLEVAKKSAIPQGTLSVRTGSEKLEGKSIGIANTLQTINISKKGKPSNYKEVLYGIPKKFSEFTSKETGRLTAEADPTGQGNTPKELLKLSKAETLKRLGIKEVELGDGEVTYDVDQSLANEWAKEPNAKSVKDLARNIDGIRKNYMEEVVRGMNYQASMDNLPTIAKKLALTTEVLANQIGAGKARLASRTLELANFKGQTDFLKQVESKDFNKLYKKAMTEFDDGAKAFDHAMVTHFANNPIKGISKVQIKKISAELNQHFQYTTMKPKRAVEAARKAMAFPNNLKAVEAKFGLDALGTSSLFNNIESIKEGRAVFTMEGGVIENLALTEGKGAFEAFIKEATHSGSGLGKFDSIKQDVTFDMNWRRAGEYMIEFLRADRMDAPIESRSLHDARTKEIQNALDVFKEISNFTENPGDIFSHVKGPLTWTNMSKAMVEFLKVERAEAPVESRFLHDKNIDIIKEAMELPKEVTYFTNTKFKEYRGSKIEVLETAESRALPGVIGKGTNRFSIYETSAQAQEAANGVYARLEAKGVKLKTYKGSTAARSNEVGKKETVLEGVTSKDGTWDLKARENFESAGEENKAKLLDVSEVVKNLYKAGDITHRQVRQFIEAQGGPMQGLIKKSASLAILPEISRSEIETIHGKEWVLEHTTPAQYIKARMYEYILSGGAKRYKNAFEASLKDYHTTLIPKSLDTMVNKILKTDLPTDHVPGMDPLGSRYYLAPHSSPFDLALINHKTGKRYSKTALSGKELAQRAAQLRATYEAILPKGQRLGSERMELSNMLDKMKTIDVAYANGRKRNAKRKGMSTWDFDDTLARTKSDVLYTTPEGKKGKLNAEQFAEKGAELLEQGYKFDFSEFNKVKGGKPGPFLEKALERAKKFGTKNQFILTARAQEAAPAIYEFLKSQGLNIPLKNITGLGNSTGEAKAMWMLEKFAEGYNDMYFADDAMQNVKAVKDVLSQLDIKSKVQQAKRLASENMSLGINEMIERRSGIEAVKEFSAAKARMLGNKRFSRSLVVPGAQDFMGLMQNFMGTGRQGNVDRAFFEKNLVDPFARATKEMNEARQKSSEDMKRLYKDIPSVRKKLNKNLENSAFTYDQAIRAHLWEKAGHEIPGLSAKDLKQMTDVVRNDAELLAFADGLQAISKGEYVTPSQNWVAETIVSDLFNLNNKANRHKFIEEWVENKNIIFSEANMNKIEATQGRKYREALEDILYRMETGSNRPTGSNRLANAHMNFINGSVGATMFLNMRSAMLQTISATNYINWAENNPAKAAAAFANQKQYWKDFSMIWNSPMLKQRRAGLEYNVQEAELAAAVAGQKNKAKAALAWLIKKGFTPTQVADSFAIAAGGSTYYRNRVKMYEKQGLGKTEARDKAFLDFQEITETSQQSSRADLISQQQASSLGRTVLAWANTPMQYMRIQEKSFRNIVNGRGDFKTDISKIAYYGAIQSLIFASLQNALFSFGLDEDEDLDDADFAKRVDRITQTVIDGQLRGMGVAGAAVSAIKNTILEFQKQELKAEDDSWFSQPDHTKTILQLTSYSPVIGSKLRKLYSASQTWNYNRDAVSEMGLDISNPGLEAGANVIEATTNVPIARIVRKINNLKEVADSENQTWQRIASLMGYSAWDLGIENTEVKDAKDRGRQKKKEAEGKALEDQFKKDQQKERDEGKKTTCAGATRSGGRCSNKPIGNGAYCTVHQKVDQRADGKKTQCTHVKSDGKRCKMKTTSQSGKCYYHD